MAGWHHWLDGCESGWTPGDGDGQGGLVCCDSWGRKESDMTERLNWTENHCRWWLQPWNQKMMAFCQENHDKPRQCVEKQTRYSADKGPHNQRYGLPSGHVQLWELDFKEDRALKNWCLQNVVLEKTPESPLDCKEINPEYSLEGLMLKLKLQYFGHLMRTAESLEKSLMLGKIEGRRRGWMPMQWTWTWANFRRWWGTERPGVL